MTGPRRRQRGSRQAPSGGGRPRAAAGEIEKLIRAMGSRLIGLVVVVGTVTVVANAWRAAAVDSWSTFAVDVGVFLGVLVALALRERLAPHASFWIIVALIFVEGLARLATLGLAGSGSMILGAGCTLVGIFFGVRTGLLAVAVALTGYAVIGLAHVAGWLEVASTVAPGRASAPSWLTQGGLLAGFAASLVVAANTMQRRLLDSLSDLRRRTAQLQRRSRQLRSRSRELHRALRNLRASERKYRLISDQITDVVFVATIEGASEYVSPSGQRQFGYSQRELLEVPMERRMTPSSAARARETLQGYLEQARKGAVDVPPAEYEYVRKDGTSFWGELQVGFVRTEKDEITGIHGVIRDVSWRRQAELERARMAEELRQSEKMQAIGQLASGVAHDFNNQLTVIQGYAELLVGDHSMDQTTRRAAEHISAAASRSADLTRQLLAFGRRGATQRVPVDLNLTVQEAVGLLSRSVDRRIRIRTELASSPTIVMGDPSQLCTALLNLGLNARDAMPEGGEVLFATAAGETGDAARGEAPFGPGTGWVELRVRDSGMGMDEETLRRAFEPFFTTKSVGQGTGMGLAAVYGTIQAHGGTIRAESRLGGGTCIHLRLPLAKTKGTVTATSGVDEAVDVRALGVLIVDDEEAICALVREIFEQHRHRVSAFTDADQAIAHFMAHPSEFDLAILDLTMPTMTGTQCLLELRRASPGLPAILMSGDTPSGQARELAADGSCRFLAKPFRAADLLAAARETVRPAAQRAADTSTRALAG